MKTSQALAASLALSVTFAGMSGPAASQEDAGKSDEVTVLDTIVITGLKGTDAAKELPVSVSVVPGNGQVADAIDPGAAITRATPNVYFGGFAQPGVDFVSMRGIGPLGQPSNSLDNSVGFSTNGAATSAFGFPPSLLDIERIEVIRGPQGTLFGRNALGGVVNVVTRPADGERELKIRGEVGNDGHHLAEFTAGGWLQENVLAGRFVARLNGVSGTIPNVVVGGEEGDTRLAAARGTLSYMSTDDLRVNLILGFDTEQRHSNYNMLLETPNFPASGADIIPDNRRKRGEATLEIQRDLEAIRLTSLTNFQRIQLDGKVDTADDLVFQAVYGFTPPHGADISLSRDTDTIFSQEVRLSSLEGEPTKWVAGVNYFHSSYSSDRDQVSSYSPYSAGLFDTRIRSHTLAAFGDVTVPLTEAFKVSGGLRAAHDRQSLDSDYTGIGFPGTVGGYAQKSDISDTYLTGRVAVSYDWTPDVMTYASVSRGYASAGFERYTLNNAVGRDSLPLRPSTGWTYEAGAKADLLDNRLSLSGSVFFNDIRDGQLVGYDIASFPVTFQFVNQDYQTYGFEIEARAEILPDLHVGAGIGLTRSRLGDVTDTAAFGAQTGNRVPNSPDFTANLDVSYRFLENFYATAQYQYVGTRAMEIANTGTLPAYHMVNAKVGWNNADWEVYGFVNNLLDERPLNFGATYSPTAHSVAVGPGRTFGLGMSRSF